jgi:hypothetical protein
VSNSAVLLIALGLFLGAGVYSFWKKKMPKSVIVVLAAGAVMSLAAGVLRL